MSRPQDLLPSERRFLAAMQALGSGRFEFLQVRHGELILDPWPTAIRYVEFGGDSSVAHIGVSIGSIEAVRSAAEFFECINNISAAEIRTFEVRSGRPVAMEIELAPEHVAGGLS
jgi:hypothetical protein